MPFDDYTIFDTEAQDYLYESPNDLNLSLDDDLKSGLKESDWLSRQRPTWNATQSPFPELESPLSSSASAGLYYEVAWNPFDRSFATIQPSLNANTSRTQEPTEYQNGYFPPNNDASYVTLSAINECSDSATFDYNLYVAHEVEEEPTPRYKSLTETAFSPTPIPDSPTDDRTFTRPRAASGHPRSRNSSISTSALQPKRDTKRKSKDLNEDRPRLRSTSSVTNRPKPSSSSPPSFSRKDTTSSPPNSGSTSGTTSNLTTTKTRTNHNHVEKQYRNRLNSHFESLLSTIPRDELPETNLKDSEGGRVSKAEVLVLAQRRIRKLERETGVLEGENEGLRERIGELKRVVVERGGFCMP